MSKNILHICSDFSRQRLYNELISNLYALGIKQAVYIPVRTAEEVNKYRNQDIEVDYHYEYILKPIYRILFKQKINSVYSNLLKKVDISKIGLSHAHFLFSDGAVALRLKKSKNIPYIVAVRNTDINIFYKYMLHLRPLALQILLEAEKIIFITPGYVNLLLDKYIPIKYHQVISQKIEVIPNGVNNFWLEKNTIPKVIDNARFRLLYVGDFTSNKNIPTLINAIYILNKQGIPVTLTLVGGGGNDENTIAELLKKDQYSSINYVGRITDSEALRNIYREHNLFVMLSFKETFGVVYIEALSQGLPIIYTKGQGIDGYFKDGYIGYSGDPNQINSVVEKIKQAMENIDSLRANIPGIINNFSWAEISKKYLNIYSNITQDNNQFK